MEIEMRRVVIRRRVKAARPRMVPTKRIKLIDNTALTKFNPSILGLGDVSLPSREVEAIAVVFDLAGFTRFCNQVDPHLAVPSYLSRFLDWLFNKVKEGITTEIYSDRTALWAELPISVKFLGDGALFLWDTRNMNEYLICSIVTTLYEIGVAYRQEFYPEIKKAVNNPPNILRCGMARGRVFSVGNGRDYVGHCINTASRLQKLSLLTFCFPRRGFDVQRYMRGNLREKVAEKRIAIRGIWESDLVWVVKQEFDNLPDREKALFGET